VAYYILGHLGYSLNDGALKLWVCLGCAAYFSRFLKLKRTGQTRVLAWYTVVRRKKWNWRKEWGN